MTSAIEQLMVDVVDAISPDSLVPHFYGEKHIHAHDSPPLVVWERGAGDFGAPHGGMNPNRLWTKTVTIVVHVWGASEEQADAIVDNELVGLARVCHAHHRPDRLEQGAANEAWLSKGHAQVLSVKVDFAVSSETQSVGQFDTIAMTGLGGSASGDGWLDSDEA